MDESIDAGYLRPGSNPNKSRRGLPAVAGSDVIISDVVVMKVDLLQQCSLIAPMYVRWLKEQGTLRQRSVVDGVGREEKKCKKE